MSYIATSAAALNRCLPLLFECKSCCYLFRSLRSCRAPLKWSLCLFQKSSYGVAADPPTDIVTVPPISVASLEEFSAMPAEDAVHSASNGEHIKHHHSAAGTPRNASPNQVS